MVLGKDSTPSGNNTTGIIPGNGQEADNTQKKEGHREGKDSAMAEQNLYSSKEGLFRRQIDPRPIFPQHFHLPTFQDAHNPRSEAPPQGELDSLH